MTFCSICPAEGAGGEVSNGQERQQTHPGCPTRWQMGRRRRDSTLRSGEIPKRYLRLITP